MNTDRSFHPIIPRRPAVSKLAAAFLLVALLIMYFPAPGVLALPAGTPDPVKAELQASWKNKVESVRIQGIFYERVRVYPADFDDSAELARAHQLLNEYGFALRSAQRVIVNRAGFDENGRVTNESLADQSIKEVASYLHTMRGLHKKLNELNGKYRLLPAGSVLSST